MVLVSRTLQEHNGSFLLIIPAPLVEAAKLEAGEKVKIGFDRGKIVLSSIDEVMVLPSVIIFAQAALMFFVAGMLTNTAPKIASVVLYVS